MTEIDGFTSASKNFYYEKGSFTKEEVLEKISERVGAVMLATVNPDNSPNLAVLIPRVASNDYLMFGVSDNQSRENIFRSKKAVLGLYEYEKDKEDKQLQNRGARIFLILEENEKILASLKQKFPKPGLVFMKIEKILPLG